MTEKTAKQTEPPLHLDMDFGEALRRFVQTRPKEVLLPVPHKRKKRKSRDKNKAPSPPEHPIDR
jgi:hypothetical protein